MHRIHTSAALFTFLVAFPAHGSPDPTRGPSEVAGYSSLWTARPFQTAADVNKPATDGQDAEAEPAAPQLARELAELEARVEALEAEVERLKTALREAGADKAKNEDHGPPDLSNLPRLTSQRALASLEALASGEAERQKLVVKRRKILPAAKNGGLDRARVEINVEGTEKKVYPWLLKVHSPADFRALTSLQLRPSKDDESAVDVSAVFEQWHRLPGADEDVERRGADLRLLREAAHYPVELLLRIVQASPPEGLQLEFAEITNQLDEGGLDRTIRLQGTADELAQALSFQEALTTSEGLKGYRWDFPPPVLRAVDSLWEFRCEAAFDPE